MPAETLQSKTLSNWDATLSSLDKTTIAPSSVSLFLRADLIVHPAHIDFGVDDVKLGTRVTKRIALGCPFVSSPMDTVTEEDMAIGMALQGGIGFIHAQSPVHVQAARVAAVKKFQNGFIGRPACMRPDQPISDLDELIAEKGIR